ncbi:MFS transporter [Klebsiella michiganensis]|uniref:hypothetical protein n=1 Tax=Klebsiella michiganensis TaxID=1134687 RepID=UPI000237D44B|nr:hypothetical protein [Klebsiella michiganensis]QNE50953.1 hypothetical protein H5403_26685 [Klebsiella michiganensis]
MAVFVGKLVALLIPLWFAIGTLGLINAKAAAIAIVASGQHRGSGSSLIVVLQFCIAFAVNSLVAASQSGTAYPMTIAIVVCVVLATGLWFFGSANRRMDDFIMSYMFRRLI